MAFPLIPLLVGAAAGSAAAYYSPSPQVAALGVGGVSALALWGLGPWGMAGSVAGGVGTWALGTAQAADPDAPNYRVTERPSRARVRRPAPDLRTSPVDPGPDLRTSSTEPDWWEMESEVEEELELVPLRLRRAGESEEDARERLQAQRQLDEDYADRQRSAGRRPY